MRHFALHTQGKGWYRFLFEELAISKLADQLVKEILNKLKHNFVVPEALLLNAFRHLATTFPGHMPLLG
jgi:hypothetical protein